MPNWKKVIVSGSDAILNSITSSAGISSSGDVYAPNFIGTASIASAVTVTPIGSPGFFDVLFTNGNNLFLTDDNTSEFAYNAASNTLIVENLRGTASLATTASFVTASNVYGPYGASSVLSSSYALNALHSISASYAENGVDISGNVNNRVLTATGNNILQGESNLTFDGQTLSTTKLTLNANNPLIVSSQAGQALTVNDDSLNVIKIGDIGGNQNETLLTVSDSNDAKNITFYTDGINSEFNSTGLKTTGNITASLNISASGDLYGRDLDVSRDVKPGRNIVVPNNGKIGTSNGIDEGDYITINGTFGDRYFETRFDGSTLFKVAHDEGLISLLESTKHGVVSSDTHQFTGSVDIKGNTNIDGNLIIDGDITAEQYIINSTVTNVTMSFSNGSTIFGDSTDDTHSFTGSLDITGSTNIVGPLSLPGFNDVSASLANLTAEGGADNLGNHIATQDLDMAGFSISASLNITASGNISASGNLIGSEITASGNISTSGNLIGSEITASGNISASGNLSADHLILNPNTTTTGSSGDNDSIIDVSLGSEDYKRGVIKRVFNFRENVPSAAAVNINNHKIAHLGDFSRGNFRIDIEVKGFHDPKSESLGLITSTASFSEEFSMIDNLNPADNVPLEINFVADDALPTLSAITDILASFMQAGSSSTEVSLVCTRLTPNGDLIFNFLPSDNPEIANAFFSGSLTTVYLDYQLYK